MKTILCCLSIFLLFSFSKVNAQINFKTEYISTSKYKGKDGYDPRSKGNLKIVQGSFRIPISVKMNENNRPTAWAIGCSGAHASLGRTKLSRDLCPSDILNLQIALIHMRPLNSKWSVLGTVGAGLYMDNDNLSKARWSNILGQGALIFIRHLKPNLELGGGVALNNTFGYPMIFPAFYFTWRLEGRYEVKVALVDAIQVSAGMRLNNYTKLNLMVEMNGMMALTERDGKKMSFTHQYTVIGLQPEITLGKSFVIPLTLGIAPYREAYYLKRSLKDFFSDDDESNPHFKLGFYCSLGISWKF